jgi:hypothetical protein
MVALLLAGLALAADPDPKVPVALVATAKGPVSVERGKVKLHSPEGGSLLPGDRLTAGEKGELVIVLLTDGRWLRVKPGKVGAVGAKGVEPADAAEVVDGPRADPANLRTLQLAYQGRQAGNAAGVILRGPNEEKEASRAKGVHPLYKACVLTDHPAMSWPSVPGAREYRVELLPGAEGAVRPLWRATVADARLPYPEDEKVLDKGGKYRWRVWAVRDGKEEPVVESAFFVASDRVAELLAKVRRLADADDPVGWLLAADAYDAGGVYGKALPLYERLAVRSPDAANYQVALAAYYARAGRDADAQKARGRARELGVDVAGDPGRTKP